jgi:hypothetical protein
MTGRLATFGAPILRHTMRQQVDRLIENLRDELERRGHDAPV